MRYSNIIEYYNDIIAWQYAKNIAFVNFSVNMNACLSFG